MQHRPVDILRAVVRPEERGTLGAALCRATFLEEVFREGIAGAVYRCLQEEQGRIRVASAAWKVLEDEYTAVTGRNMVLARWADRIVAACEERRLPVVILRGARLIRDVYPAAGMRPATDIDLLFYREDALRVRGLLSDLGMRPHPVFPLFFQDGPVYLDVHLDTAGFLQTSDPEFGLSLRDERVWGTSLAWQPAGRYARCLDRVHECIACALHAQEHSYARLVWFMDAVFLTQTSPAGPFDWDALLEAALRRNFAQPVFFLLSYVSAQRFLCVPQGVLESLSRRRPLNAWERRSLRVLEQERRTEVFGEGLCFFSVRGVVRRFLFLWYVLLRPRPGRGRGGFSFFPRCGRIAAAALRGVLR